MSIEKMHKMEVVNFYWEQNQDDSLGNNISDSSEKLLQREREDSIIYDFIEDVCVVRGLWRLWQRLAASHKELMSLLDILMVF